MNGLCSATGAYRPNSPCRDEGNPQLSVQPCVPYYNCPPAYKCPPAPIKKSISFLTTQELFSYKAIPAAAVFAYLATSVGTIANQETFVQWFGSEYTAVNMVNTLTVGSMAGVACYIYGRRHIRHAGAFQKVIYPVFTSVFFHAASHFSWAFIKEMSRDQDCFDYHWRVVWGLLSGGLFLYTGRSYLKFIDHW